MSSADQPVVTVLLPVYNADAFLSQAISSILSQTWSDFALLIMDDGSTDESLAVARQFSDPRIRLVKNDRNHGLSYTLNRGLDLARGEFVARMDADDISLPERLEKQVAFLRANPSISICGTSIRFFGDVPAVDVLYPSGHETICCRMLFVNSIAHPSVMLRAETFRRLGLRYDPTSYAEDFDLWQRCTDRMLLDNLPEVLLLYRISRGSFTQTHREGQALSVAQIFRRQLTKLEAPTDDVTLECHRAIGVEEPCEHPEQLIQVRKHLVFLWRANQRLAVYPPLALRRTLKHYWEIACKKYCGDRRVSGRLYPCRELGTESGIASVFWRVGERLAAVTGRPCTKA